MNRFPELSATERLFTLDEILDLICCGYIPSDNRIAFFSQLINALNRRIDQERSDAVKELLGEQNG